MRIDAGQHMRMEQRMKLSPRMIQSMEILQLPALALEERIEQELEQNPLLELRENGTEAEAEAAAAEVAAEDGELERPLVIENEGGSRDFQRADDLSEQYGEDWAQNTTESADFHTPARRDYRHNGERDGKMDAMANTASPGPGLTEQLADQWRFIEADGPTRRAGEHLIEFIDEDGYVRTDLARIADQAPPGVTLGQLEGALALLQRQIEPVGIGARDLPECLLLQLRALIEEEVEAEDLLIARRLVTHHLKDLELNRLPRIARQSGLTLEQIKAGLARLRRLDPRPGRRIAPERLQAVIPDVTVEYDPFGDRYVAGLNHGRHSSLRISPHYRRLSKDRGQERGTRQYLARNMGHARWLIDALQQRDSTLLRVVNAVIDAQREFLDHGPLHLRPLPMIQVAEQLGIHVGTVSRAVSEKYIQTPRGVFPLRMFFSGGTESASGEEMSWAAVQATLREIIDGEDPASPYSDDQLVERLGARGIKIARRTVAKYRQQMNIPPARRRRTY